MTNVAFPAPAAESFTLAAPAPTSALEAFRLLCAHLPEAEALETLAALGGDYGASAPFADVTVSAAAAAAVLLGRLHPADGAESRARVLDLVLLGHSDAAELDEEIEETRADYVARCYGDDGDEPGDCYAVVVRQNDGAFVVTDGDDDHREQLPGVFLTLEGAAQAAYQHAEASDEGDGQDAEGVVAAERAAARGRANATGQWAFGFVSPDGSTRAELRFDDRADAQALVDEWFEGVRAHNPGTNILWHLMTTASVLFRDSDGEWVAAGEADDDDRSGVGC